MPTLILFGGSAFGINCSKTIVKGKLFRSIHNMHNGIKSNVSLKGENTPFFSCNCGVRQGDNLSPVLFSLYLNDLEEFLIYINDLQA